MAMKTTLSAFSVSMKEFKNNPNEALKKSAGQSVAVMSSHNKPVFYIVPTICYEAMLEEINDVHLVRIVSERLKQKDLAIEVKLDEL